MKGKQASKNRLRDLDTQRLAYFVKYDWCILISQKYPEKKKAKMMQ